VGVGVGVDAGVGVDHLVGVTWLHGFDAAAAASLAIPPTLGQLNQYEAHHLVGQHEADAVVNLTHMELLLRFSVADHFPGFPEDKMLKASGELFRAALKAPYLLYEILAISARRLSLLEDLPRAELFIQYASSLQARAVSIFNETVPMGEIMDDKNSAPTFIVTILLVCHRLADVLLVGRTDPDLNLFLDRYLDFVPGYRAMVALRSNASPSLKQDQNACLRWFLDWGAYFDAATSPSGYCDPIRNYLALDPETGGGSLSPESRAACIEAMRTLEVGIDHLLLVRQPKSLGYKVIFAWPSTIPFEFDTLLAQRRPEALIVFAYWGVILHLSRNLWHVGDAGEHLIRLICQYLGPDW